MSYEVRLQAWNCSCAAFAFAAFSGDWDGSDAFNIGEGNAEGRGLSRGKEGRYGWHIGGVTLGEDVPFCKHLLACVLAERVDGLSAFVEERVVEKEEIAGWAAGWGG